MSQDEAKLGPKRGQEAAKWAKVPPVGAKVRRGSNSGPAPCSARLWLRGQEGVGGVVQNLLKESKLLEGGIFTRNHPLRRGVLRRKVLRGIFFEGEC